MPGVRPPPWKHVATPTADARCGADSFDCVAAELAGPPSPLHDGVAPGRFAEPSRAELRCPLLRLEVHVDQAEAVAVPGGPLEVVHQAPLEVAFDRNAVGRR